MVSCTDLDGMAVNRVATQPLRGALKLAR